MLLTLKRSTIRILWVGLLILLFGLIFGLSNPPEGSIPYEIEGYCIILGLLVVISSFIKTGYDRFLAGRRPALGHPSNPQAIRQSEGDGSGRMIKATSKQATQGAEHENDGSNRDLESSMRNGFFVSEGGSVNSSPGFAQCLQKHCEMRSDLGNEQILYGIMLAIREFDKNLSEPDFLAARRIAWRYAMNLRERWSKHHPGEQARPLQEQEKTLLNLRSQWVAGLKPGQKQDMLTHLYELQLKNAREIIASGDNFQPELLMYHERDVGGTIIQGEDPMSQAIKAILSSKPEGYSFAAEAWRGPAKKAHKWGDIARLKSKVECFLQVCAENGGPFLSRTFSIDRAERTLTQDLEGGESRMPTVWRVGDVPSWYFDKTASGAYA